MNILSTFDPSELAIDLLGLEELMPPFPAGRVEEIWPGAITAPTPTLVLITILGLDKVAIIVGFLVDGESRDTLQVWIDDYNHLWYNSQ